MKNRTIARMPRAAIRIILLFSASADVCCVQLIDRALSSLSDIMNRAASDAVNWASQGGILDLS